MLDIVVTVIWYVNCDIQFQVKQGQKTQGHTLVPISAARCRPGGGSKNYLYYIIIYLPSSPLFISDFSSGSSKFSFYSKRSNPEFCYRWK